MPAETNQAPSVDIEAVNRSLKAAVDYKDRIRAVEILGTINSKKSKDILRNVMLHDPIHSVQNEAFLKLQAFGESVRLPKKNPKHLKSANDKIKTVQRLADFMTDREAYLQVFVAKYPKDFEVLSYEKRGKLETHIENVIRNMPKK